MSNLNLSRGGGAFDQNQNQIRKNPINVRRNSGLQVPGPISNQNSGVMLGNANKGQPHQK